VASADVANVVERKEGGNEEAADRYALLRGLEVPEPVFFRTIEPYSAAEQPSMLKDAKENVIYNAIQIWIMH